MAVFIGRVVRDLYLAEQLLTDKAKSNFIRPSLSFPSVKNKNLYFVTNDYGPGCASLTFVIRKW